MFGDNVTRAASVSGRCEHAAGSLVQPVPERLAELLK
jgi:hypothetical protein